MVPYHSPYGYILSYIFDKYKTSDYKLYVLRPSSDNVIIISMADTDMEKWALKSKQIEAERMKAAEDLVNQKPDKSNLAFLDPKATKVKGWSKDPDVIRADAERMGNRALVFAIAGVVLSLIGYVGGMVASSFKLGLGGAIVSGLPSSIGYICLAIAVLLGLIVMGQELYLRIKRGTKLTSVFWTGFSAALVVVVYLAIQTLLMTMH